MKYKGKTLLLVYYAKPLIIRVIPNFYNSFGDCILIAYINALENETEAGIHLKKVTQGIT